jgi:phosphoribosylamine--glycine ligase
LAWKLRQSPLCEELYCAPGNPGIAAVADRVPIAVEEIARLADFAAEMRIDLTVVGPELPLSLGIVDEFARRELRVFGPTKAAAEIEGSKVFAKEFMTRHGVPTSPFEIAADEASARRAAKHFGYPVVLKADGLASGKGVFIVREAADLDAALQVFFADRRFGSSADRVVVERCESGEEISFMALCDGERLLPLATAKDYKRLGDDDGGPNTGGMGAHSPAGILTAEETNWVLEHVMRPTVAGLAAENRRFCGILYAGLMMTADGPVVLEFNARLGDPETQPLSCASRTTCWPSSMPARRATSAGRSCASGARRRTCVVLASQGYPEQPVKGEAIVGIERAAALPGVAVFHAGTAVGEDGVLVSSGGRVLDACATGATLRDALRAAYAAAAENRLAVEDLPQGHRQESIGARRRGRVNLFRPQKLMYSSSIGGGGDAGIVLRNRGWVRRSRKWARNTVVNMPMRAQEPATTPRFFSFTTCSRPCRIKVSARQPRRSHAQLSAVSMQKPSRNRSGIASKTSRRKQRMPDSLGPNRV